MRCLDLGAMTLPPMSIIEKNVSVYLAGYLARKLKEKFTKCQDCLRKWLATGSEKEELEREFIFLDQKNYYKDVEINSKGLTAPSKILLSAVIDMELKFRQCMPLFITKKDVFENIFRVFESIEAVNKIVCSEPKCDPTKKYVRGFYARLRIHFDLELKNRNRKQLKKRKNKKLQKLETLAS